MSDQNYTFPLPTEERSRWSNSLYLLGGVVFTLLAIIFGGRKDEQVMKDTTPTTTFRAVEVMPVSPEVLHEVQNGIDGTPRTQKLQKQR